MGLDMYLSKRTFIGANYEHRNVKAKVSITIGKKKVNINPNKISYIHEGVAYWRKANHIHAWFVENCQGGEDDCGNYDVSTSKLKELIELCEQVLEKKDECREADVSVAKLKELIALCKEIFEKKDNAFSEANLPTQSGFFFGGTEYGEYYYSAIEDTINMLNEAIADVDENDYNIDFLYHSSW
jgi:hypothetical protein